MDIPDLTVNAPQTPQLQPTSSIGDDGAILTQNREFYIEVFQGSHAQSDRKKMPQKSINSISSAYEVFWKENFDECISVRTCLKCLQVFLTPQQLLHHLEHTHQISNAEQCFPCRMYFVDESQRLEHISQIHAHSNSFSHSCEVCFKHFTSEAEKEVHVPLHQPSERCPRCFTYFPCKRLQSEHLLDCSSGKNELICRICGCKFKTSHMLQSHSLRHIRTSCDICHCDLRNGCVEDFDDTEVIFIRHLKSFHGADEINSIILSLRKEDEEESNLDKVLFNQILESAKNPENSALPGDKEHQLFKKTKDQKISNPSQHKFKSKLNEEINTLKRANELPQKTKDIIKYFCRLCSCGFKLQEKLRQHEKKHNAEGFQCHECHKNYQMSEGFGRNSLDHHKPFSCDICFETFIYRRAFKKHMHTHGLLVKPKAIRYKCNLCTVSCGTVSSLRIHLLTHTDHKPYLCEKCGLRFRRPRALKAHEHAVHDLRDQHFCPQCESSTHSQTSLLRHIQCVHGGIRRFICGICCSRWPQNQNLRRHLKFKHNIDVPPIGRLGKKSTREIHIIPPVENLKPTDPILNLLKSVILEEQAKLDAITIPCHENKKVLGENHLQQSSSNLLQSSSGPGVDSRQSLSILGDVASKAAPLEDLNCSSALQSSEFQGITSFLCNVCQFSSESLNGISRHLSQCHQEKSLDILNPDRLLNDVVLSKPVIIFPPSSSLTPVSMGIPQQFYLIPASNADPSALQIECGAMPPLNYNGQAIDFNFKPPSVPMDVVSGESHGTLPLLTKFESVELGNMDLQNQSTVASLSPQGSGLIKNSSIGNVSSLSQVHSYSFPLAMLLPALAETLESSRIEKDSLTNNIPEENSYSCDASASFSGVLNTSFDKSLEHTENISFTFPSKDQKVVRISPQGVSLWEAEASTKGDSVENEQTNILAPLNTSLQESTMVHQPAIELCAKEKLATDLSAIKETIFASSGQLVQEYNKPIEELGNKSNTCPDCGKQLSSPSNFKRHLQVHFGDKPHTCTFCAKSFRYKVNLTVHLRSHSGLRPYECPICKKKLRYLSELKEHKQSHDGLKLFICNDCGQKFARLRDLNRHSRSHSSGKRPICGVCKKSFSRLDYLKRHMRSHKKQDVESETLSSETGRTKETELIASQEASCKLNCEVQNSYFCEICSVSFCTEEDIKVHQKQCHQDSNLKDVAVNTTIIRSHQYNIIGNDTYVNETASKATPHNSEDLISLAYQAAEDGVEFMFLEELKSTKAEKRGIESNSIEDVNNVVYVQIIGATS